MRALLDVNVLLALFDPDHPHNAAAVSWWTEEQGQGWDSCPLTQTFRSRRFVLSLSPAAAHRRGKPFAAGATAEAGAHHLAGRHFDQRSLLFDQARLLGSKQITDVYLFGLAVKNGGRLATLDQSIRLGAVRRAEPRHFVVLS